MASKIDWLVLLASTGVGVLLGIVFGLAAGLAGLAAYAGPMAGGIAGALVPWIYRKGVDRRRRQRDER